MEKEKKYLKPEAEVIELPDIATDNIIASNIPDLPNGFGGFDEEEDF